ncbi:MAG TPA: efflux RND transporter permease subunit, partial [Longimicrobium sp.]
MNFSGLFIRRPIMTSLLMITIAVFGIGAYRSLPISDLPTVDYPTVSVNASLPGASPQTMAAAVATPLEKRFSTIAGIDNMTSTSSLGSTSITIQFSLDRDVDAAAQDVQAAIAQTQRSLPQDVQPPSYRKANPADAPILFFALTSPTVSLQELNRIAETLLAQQLSTVNGVAQVQVYGSQKYAVRVQLDPTALAYRNLAIGEVASAIGEQNSNLPTGVLAGTTTSFTVQTNGQARDAAAFRTLTVAHGNGTAVQLGSLGRVLDDVQDNKTASWYNGTRAIVLAVQRQPGSNTVAVAEQVRAAVDSIRPRLPGNVELSVLFDRSEGIQESVHEVKFTLVLTLVLVVLVIFLFLRNLSATVIPSLALPMSILGTFAVMYALGYSLNNLSLMAITLAVGFVVDDAIVMLENIVRHLEMGKTPMEAAVDGAREVGFTIISMTVSLTAVFIPLLFLGGIIGRLFREFAVTIAVAILVSGVVSLTLTPMLASRFLRSGAHTEHGRFYQVTERGYDWLLEQYRKTLEWAMRRRRLVMAFSLAVLVGTVFLFRMIPKGFIPNQDTGQLNVNIQAAQGISFPEMVRHQQEVAALAQRDTNLAGVMSSVGGGGGGGGGGNSGRLLLTLKPRGDRATAEEIVSDLRRKLGRVPGVNAFVQVPPALQIGGRSSRSQYQFTLQGTDIETLYPAAQAFEEKVRALDVLQDVSSDLELSNPQVSVSVDPLRASAYGITSEQVQSTLYNAYGSRQVSTIYAPEDEYWVMMELLPQYQADPTALGYLHVRSQSGALVPMSAVASLARTAGPVSVSHSGQLPSVTISFNLRDGVALGEAARQVEALAAESLPDGISTAFSGTAQVFQSTQAGLLVLVGVAVFVIYVILGILYESVVHPLTILSGLPFAGFGALLALLLFGVELSVYAFVGIILLIGIVKKNAIMMIDFALEVEREEGRTPADAIFHAALMRFRPITMTTVAALVGTLPLALASGAGSETRRPLGIAVVGGLAFSQLITLY